MTRHEESTMTIPDVHARDQVVEAAREIALQGFARPGQGTPESDPALAAVVRAGSELWLDTGDLSAAMPLWSVETTALTTNNTLVNKVIQAGALDGDLLSAAREMRSRAPDLSDDDLVLELGFIANARVSLGLVQNLGAQVSVELHPAVGDDIEGTLLFARRYYALCPQRFVIKVPLTPDGFLAVRRLGEEGIPVNFTLGFSARQNHLAAHLSRPRYVNVFLGRLNSVIADNKLGDGRNVGEKATLASQRTVLEARRADRHHPTRQIAASIRSGQQLVDLAGVDVITAPPEAVKGYLDLNVDPRDIRSRVDEDPQVAFAGGKTAQQVGAAALWEVGAEVREVAAALASVNTDDWHGDDLIRFTEDHGLRDLFHRWSPAEIAEVRAKGKIPQWARWQGKVALDTLMTVAALQSFTADQEALDDRLRGLIARA
jgi:transaldolase